MLLDLLLFPIIDLLLHDLEFAILFFVSLRSPDWLIIRSEELLRYLM